MLRHTRKAEVVRLSTHSEDQKVVLDRAVCGDQPLGSGLETRHFRHAELEILLATQHRADRPRDLFRLEPGGSDLIQEGLEQVVVVPVHEHDVHRCFAQRARRAQSTEPRTDDDDLRTRGGRARRHTDVLAGVGLRPGGRADVRHGTCLRG